jgi:hypothetical protein
LLRSYGRFRIPLYLKPKLKSEKMKPLFIDKRFRQRYEMSVILV